MGIGGGSSSSSSPSYPLSIVNTLLLVSNAEGANVTSKIGVDGFKSVKRRLRLGLDFSAHKVVSIASV